MTTASRRTVLGAATAATGIATLAACGASGGGADIGQGPNGSTDSEVNNAPASPSSGVQLIKLSRVPVGGSASATLDGAPVVVSQQAAGNVTAFSAICTHMGCTVGTGGAQLHCPCHGSVYNAFTGAVIHGPAPKALHPIPVKVVGDSVVST